jgi:hypothetical protein
MYLETKILEWVRPDGQPELNQKSQKYIIIKAIICVAILTIALLVSWDCNSEVTGALKIVNLIVSGLFSSFYLVFYLIYRIILNNPCY